MKIRLVVDLAGFEIEKLIDLSDKEVKQINRYEGIEIFIENAAGKFARKKLTYWGEIIEEKGE